MSIHDLAVSVVVNTFNHEQFIFRCIEGIVSQDFIEEFEILVIDDASTDSTISILDTIKVPSHCILRVVRLETNEHSMGLWPGLSHIRSSNSTFVAFCDGDDYWIDKGKLARQVQEMRALSEIVLVHTDYYLLEKKSSGWIQIERSNKELAKAINTKTAFDLINGNSIKSSTALIRRDAIDFAFFENALGIPAKDWLLFLIVVTKGKILFMNEKSTVHRVTTRGIWNGLDVEGKTQIKDSVAWYCASHFPDQVIRDVFREKVANDWIRKKISNSKIYQHIKHSKHTISNLVSKLVRKSN